MARTFEIPYDDQHGDQQTVFCTVTREDGEPVVTILGTIDARYVAEVERGALAAAAWDARHGQREKGDDDGVEYADPRDARDGRE